MIDINLAEVENNLSISDMKKVPNPIYSQASTLAILNTLSTADSTKALDLLTHLTAHPTPSPNPPPTPLQLLSACAINPLCGDRLLQTLFTSTPNTSSMISSAPKVFSIAAHNLVLYKECLDVLIQYSEKVVVDKALVGALAEKGECGKECLRKLVGEGKGVVFDEWEKGDVVDVVRGRFGHAVLGEMVERLGVVAWQSCNDRRYLGII